MKVSYAQTFLSETVYEFIYGKAYWDGSFA